MPNIIKNILSKEQQMNLLGMKFWPKIMVDEDFALVINNYVIVCSNLDLLI